MSLQKEAFVEEELYYLFRTVLKNNKFEINGVKFANIKPQYNVNGGVADLVLSFYNGKHFLVIECKRKIAKPSGIRTIRDFDPLGSNVINQALNYAVKLGAHAFATTNGETFALFRTPTAGEPFRIDTHRLLVKEIKLEEKYIEEILTFLTKWYTRKPVRLIEVDWLFISRLRSFVSFLSNQLKPVIKRLEKDEKFAKIFKTFKDKVGDISSEQIARETAYLLMNKIIFYKILERHYNLPKLKPLSAPDGKSFHEFLKTYFRKAIETTKDFEPIFITEFYDEIPLPDRDYVFDEINAFIKEMDTYKLEEVGSDVVGYIYEELIPDEERHKLGQFYTPPPIAELITKWAIRTHKDLILDPAVGSGTFLVKAYQRLVELKIDHYQKSGKRITSKDLHKEILSQLYAVDINPFPAHLTSMNLAMREVRYPTSEMNIIVNDFFNLRAKIGVFAPYIVKTPKGEVKRHIIIPTFDVIVANPPYTRWIEIPKKTQESINKSLGNMLKKYKLSGGIGKEAGIYVHFIMHAYDFLKNNGRLGMIISNSWLQSDYGINFANYLLDHYKVKAVIDFNQRLFRIPLIATCVILLEKEKDERARKENKTVFIYVDEEAKVEEILDAIENPEGWKEKFLINDVKQDKIPTDEKWIKMMLGSFVIGRELENSPYMCKLGDLFETRHGNITGIFARGGTGGNVFFYLTKEEVEERGLDKFVYPLLSTSRYSKFFKYNKKDWEKLKDKGKVCYVFTAHKPRSQLPRNIREYIEYGEKYLRTRAGKTCNQSISSQIREKSKEFFGWYDLGEILPAPIYVPYYAQYIHRFTLANMPVALDADFIAFIPKFKMSKTKLKALLAYLNSNFNRFYIETHGRTTGGGMLSIEVKQASEMPVLNIRKLNDKQLFELSYLFDKLEETTRKIGGADSINQIEKIQYIINEIDITISKLLMLKKDIVERIQKAVKIMLERRISRTKRARPESVKGEEEPRIKPPKKRKTKKPEEVHRPLTSWM